MAPIIKLSREAELKLTAWAIATGSREFSGLGLIEKEGQTFHVIDVDLLGVGSTGFTEFAPERQRMLPLDERRKLWFHRHPVGNGIYGPHNWSGTDERTCTKEPLGGIPQLVQWSVAIVRTPGGWVGRVDFHVPAPKTFHCPVEPKLPTSETIEEARYYITPDLERYVEELQAEYNAMHQTNVSRYQPIGGYEEEDYDINWDFDENDGRYRCINCDVPLEEASEVLDLNTQNSLPTWDCPNCGEIYVLTDRVPRVEEKPAWKQTSWWNRLLGGRDGS